MEYYVLEGEQGRGGIGIVMRARDRRTDRVVALKQLQSMDHAARLRFEREMRITAKLQHPGVVPVHETGRFATGEPFYAMKLVEGRSLKEVIAEKMTLDERLALLPQVLAVAETIAYAHSQRILHRDLKPSNVIMGAYGETVVIDWGLARDLLAGNESTTSGAPYRAAQDPQLSRAGQILGTPAYMAPEQARGEVVDGRADVYSIGAILYHVLTGTPPFTGATSADVVARVLDGAPIPILDRDPACPPELSAITTKAMARDRNARYSDPGNLAEDLRRFLTGQLVKAHRYSFAEVIGRWLRRHKAAVFVASVAGVALATLSVVSVSRIVSERNAAIHEKRQTREALDRELHAKQESALERDRFLLAESKRLLSVDPTRSVDLLAKSSVAKSPDVIDIVHQARGYGLSSFVYQRTRGTDSVPFATSTDGSLLALAGDTLQIWDVRARKKLLETDVSTPVSVIAFGPDAGQIATGHNDGTVQVWTIASGEKSTAHKLPKLALNLSFSANGRWLAAGDSAGNVVLLDLVARKPLATFELHDATMNLRFAAGDAFLLAASFDGEAAVLDSTTMVWRQVLRASGSNHTTDLVDGGHQIASWDGRRVTTCPVERGPCRINELGVRDGVGLFVPGSTRFVLCTPRGSIELVDYAARKSSVIRDGMRSQGGCLAVSSDGHYVLSSERGGLIQVRLDDGAVFEYHGQIATIMEARFSPHSGAVVSSAQDGSLRVWTPPVFPLAQTNVLEGVPLQFVGFSPKDDMVAVRGTDARLVLWPTTGAAPRVQTFASQPVRVRFSPDGSTVYTSHANGEFRASDVYDGKMKLLRATGWMGAGLEISPSGRYVAMSAASGDITVWDTAAQTASTLRGSTNSAYFLLFGSTDSTLISASNDGNVRRWDVSDGTGQLLYAIDGSMNGIAWLERDHVFLTANRDGRIRAYDLDTKEVSVFAVQAKGLSTLSVSANGHVSAIFRDGTLFVWNRSGQLLMTSEGVSSAVQSPDGRLIAIGYKSGVTELVDPESPTSRAAALAHVGTVVMIAFSSSGRALVTAGADGIAKRWDVNDLMIQSLDPQLSTLVQHEP